MKINNKILALLIVFIAIVSISAVSAEDIAADDAVAAPVDDIAVVEASAEADDVLSTTFEVPENATVADIEAIINQTSAGDTLSFAENATYDFGNIKNPIMIDHTLILQGNGATIQGYQGFKFSADEEDIGGSEVHNLNFIMTQDVLWKGRALEFTAGDGYVIEGCTFTNGNAGIYIKNGKGSKNKLLIENNKFYADDGATNSTTITGDFGKQEEGMKAINIMGGSGVRVINNTFEGDMLDAISIASGATNIEVYDNTVSDVWYGIFYGGGVSNITTAGNIFSNSKAFAIGIIKGAGNSDIYENIFETEAGEILDTGLERSAIYVQEGNTAHGYPSQIDTILIYENIFYGEDSNAVSASSQGGMITPKGEFTVVDNTYESSITVFLFNDNNTYSFRTNNFVTDNNVTIEGNYPIGKYIFDINEKTVELTVPDDATGYLLIDIDGDCFYTEVEDGSAISEIWGLRPGNHTVTATYTGDLNYAADSETEIITIPETIISEDLIKIEKAPDRFEALFTDMAGNPLVNANVTFEINNVVYNRTTDKDGKAGMNINLVAGEYEIIITNLETGEFKNNDIIILSRFEETNDLVKYFENASQYVIKVLDDEGNPVKAGETVTFNINGVFYNRTTDNTGHVKLTINLQPGNYTITASYKNCEVSNKVTVLPTLTADDLTKKYGEAGAFKAKLVDGQGKAYANQAVNFNINGVLYTRNTDSAGIASLNINLMPGVYVITSQFGNALTSNTVTITA